MQDQLPLVLSVLCYMSNRFRINTRFRELYIAPVSSAAYTIMDRKPLHPKSSALTAGELVIEKPAAKRRKPVECVRKKATNQGHLSASILYSHQKRSLLSRGKTILYLTFTPVKSKPSAKFTNLLNTHTSLQKR